MENKSEGRENRSGGKVTRSVRMQECGHGFMTDPLETEYDTNDAVDNDYLKRRLYLSCQVGGAS